MQLINVERYFVVLVSLAVWMVQIAVAMAQTVPSNAIVLQDPSVMNCEAARLGNQLYLSPAAVGSAAADAKGNLAIPRFAASLKGIGWLGSDTQGNSDGIELKVEQTQWLISWKNRPAAAVAIVLAFDTAPQLLTEVTPATAGGDGSIFLTGCLAQTVGEKIRYEPQTFKNTVGYWVGKQDYAQWQFEVTQPASYNVAILQGCSAEQAGSRAKLSVFDENSAVSLDFEVLDTGGFQNFQWRHLGQLNIEAAGTHSLKIEPLEIKKSALMDVRAVHLIRLPH